MSAQGTSNTCVVSCILYFWEAGHVAPCGTQPRSFDIRSLGGLLDGSGTTQTPPTSGEALQSRGCKLDRLLALGA